MATQQRKERSPSPEPDLALDNFMLAEDIGALAAKLKENLLKGEKEREPLKTPSIEDQSDLQKRCKELEQEKAKGQARISQMQLNYCRLSKDSESQINKLNAQLQGYTEAKKIAERYQKDTQKRIVEANALKKKAAAVGDLQKEIGELEKRCDGLTAVEKELETTKKELEAERKERAFLERKAEDFKARVKQLDNWEKLQEDLARALTARDAYKRRAEELEKEVAALKKGKR